MSSTIGETLKISLFGESHGPAIGVLIEGLPAGEAIDAQRLQAFLNRRAPGRGSLSTPRRETDTPEFLSGILDGHTTGAPLCAVIQNRDARPGDYEKLRDCPRPSHADYPAHVRYRGQNDMRGGGHFSGRLTAPLCVAGGIALQILERRGVHVGAHAQSVGDASDRQFDPVNLTREEVHLPGTRDLPVLEEAAAEKMRREIEEAAKEGDSVGGVLECAALGLPPGIGDPIFGGVENRLSAMLFGIPAVRGIEFGAGFSAAGMRGSQHNDPYFIQDGEIRTRTNHHGGVLGGITTGMPLIFRVALKPTPSIGQSQQTVRLSDKSETALEIKGRHDPCIALRAVPCVEAAAALTLLDLLLASERERSLR
ncbi:MAG: chorismate synthase [Christensenellales bacterium]|jgi:chorismate synthase